LKAFAFVGAMAMLAAVTAAATPVRAEPYPEKPIRIINPLSAGGASDILVRALAEKLQERFGKSVVVENRTGGGMNVGARACADAPNDGYTLCIFPGEVLTLAEFTFKSLPYNPERDFEPIINCFINTQVMVVSSKLGLSSLDEIAAYSKANPGTMAYSTLAIPMQIIIEDWKKKTGADLVMVPFRGGGELVTGLLTGTTPVSIVGLPNFIQHIQSGVVKAIAVDSAERSPLFPEVPTMGELGFRSLVPVYFGLVAPAGTPKDIIMKLNEEIAAIGNETSFRQKRLIDIGNVPIFDTPDHFAAYLKEQREISRRLIQESGFQPR